MSLSDFKESAYFAQKLMRQSAEDIAAGTQAAAVVKYAEPDRRKLAGESRIDRFRGRIWADRLRIGRT